MTCSLEDAQNVLSSALQAGFRESGIMSITGPPMVAVRSSGMLLDSVIGYVDEYGTIDSLVNEEYLRGIMTIVNDRFATNRERIGRFQQELLTKYHCTQSLTLASESTWEDAAARRERKRREGLLKQQVVRDQERTPLKPLDALDLDTSINLTADCEP